MPSSPSIPPPPLSSKQESVPAFISRQTGGHRYFFSEDLIPAKSTAGLAVACGGWEQCAADYHVERTTFRFYAVELVCRGRGWFGSGGNETPLFAGSIFSYGPGIAHRIRSDPSEPMEKYFVDFSGREAEALVADLQRAGVMQVTQVDMMTEWFEQLLDAGNRTGRHASRICTLLTELIVRHAMENAFLATNAISPSHAAYERCRAMLRRDFLTLSSAEELAHANHLAPAYMSRLFQKYGDESSYQTLIRLKMNHAAGRLTTSVLPMKEIGAEVGFPDPYHFSRVFKRTFGVAPKTFRENYHRSTTK